MRDLHKIKTCHSFFFTPAQNVSLFTGSSYQISPKNLLIGIPCIEYEYHVLLRYFVFSTFPFNAKAARIEVRIVTGPRTGRSALRIPERACDFPLLRKVQTVSGAKPVSYLIGTWRKRPRREFDHSPSYSAELTN